jgi:hypothetical protein
MRALEDQLHRVEKQNGEILAVLTKAHDNRKWYPAEDVARRTDRQPWTIRQLCNKGLIRGIKGEDGKWKISAEELSRLETEGVPRLPR